MAKEPALSHVLASPSGTAGLNADGTLHELRLYEAGAWSPVPFRADEHRGPRWWVSQGDAEQPVDLQPVAGQPASFRGRLGTLAFGLDFSWSGRSLCLRASLENNGEERFAPTWCGLKLGLDTYMVSAPAWDNLYFPTLLRCEKTHFWGYCMTPVGRILGLASPDPVAGWSMDFNFTMYGPYRHEGHRIFTFNLHVLNTLPLPERHPQDRTGLGPGERATWTIHLVPLASLEQVKPVLARLCDAPMIDLDRHTLAPGEIAQARIFSPARPVVTLGSPDGSPRQELPGLKPLDQGQFGLLVSPGEAPGVYLLTASTPAGKTSEAMIYVRRPWSWYLRQARREALAKPQKASTHMETWLGFYSAFLARKHFPEAGLDGQAESEFRRCLGLMYNVETGEPVIEPGRVQNTAAMVGLLTDLYEAGGTPADLDLAARLADWLIQRQGPDGAFRASLGVGVHYTSVAYMAKYMLELALVEGRLGSSDPAWQERHERHYRAAQAAVDDLERLRDRIGTEGEHTFEDGMISCTSLQLAHFALLQEDPFQREKYAAAARHVLRKHACLEQNLIPDCRMNGATLRFWEAQYDVLIKHNMFNSPHGWTSWKVYATWYLYQLTGEEELLRQTMDTLGACMQAMSLDGVLRWAFVPDPHVRTRQFVADPERPGRGRYQDAVLGEQYVDMLSGWWKAPPGASTGGYRGQGGCCDNDVHEHFKCLEEVALTSAYVLEREGGQVLCWNCRAQRRGDEVAVEPLEEIVSAVHLNLHRSAEVSVHFPRTVARASTSGREMFWVRL